VSGAVAHSRGALYALLKNRLYLGKMAYRGQIQANSDTPAGENGPVCRTGSGRRRARLLILSVRTVHRYDYVFSASRCVITVGQWFARAQVIPAA
jgi:hypothetical protein